MFHKFYLIAAISCGSFVLSACVSNGASEPVGGGAPSYSPIVRSESLDQRIRSQLPLDADLDRMDDQMIYVPRGAYVAKGGAIKPLPSPDDGGVSWSANGRPAVSDERADRTRYDPVKFSLPDKR